LTIGSIGKGIVSIVAWTARVKLPTAVLIAANRVAIGQVRRTSTVPGTSSAHSVLAPAEWAARDSAGVDS